MKNLTVDTIAKVTGGVLTGRVPAGEISTVTSDSRAVTEDCLFAAIPGERADGHDFIAAALEQGAKCALAQRRPAEAEGCVVLVEDTVSALQRLAAFYRGQFDIPVLGITGSVGKTTAKEMAAAVLSQKFRVHKTAGNFNNDLGVPLTLFGLREEHEAAVVELGVSHPGDMARIAAVAKPTLALYTNIGDAHLEYLGSREGVLREKSGMNAFLPAEGTVFCNGDDPLLRGMACPQRKILCGLGPENEVRAEELRALPGGGTGCVIVRGARRIPVEISAFGEHLASAAVLAAAVGLELGLDDGEIAAGIAAYRPVGSRGRLLRTPYLTVIDDCYNANPTSTASALRSLAKLPGRRVAVLGDMRELGERSTALHRETGALAKELGIDLVLTTGGQAAELAAGAAGISRHFADKTALCAALGTLLRPGDAVLVKASRGAAFEDVTAALEALTLPEG